MSAEPLIGYLWTDNGPECQECRGTVYRYHVNDTSLIGVRCVGCHAETLIPAPSAAHEWHDVRDLSAWHRVGHRRGFFPVHNTERQIAAERERSA